MKPQNALIVVQSLLKKFKPLERKLTDLTVNSKESYDTAGALVKQMKELAKMADIEEKKITDPLNQALKAAKEHFKPFKDEVKQIEEATKADMIKFLDKQQGKQKALDKKFEDGEIKKVSTYVAHQEELTVQSRNSQVRGVQVLVIDDVNKVPREFLVPDEKLIKEALKAGKKVAGCRMETKTNIAI